MRLKWYISEIWFNITAVSRDIFKTTLLCSSVWSLPVSHAKLSNWREIPSALFQSAVVLPQRRFYHLSTIAETCLYRMYWVVIKVILTVYPILFYMSTFYFIFYVYCNPFYCFNFLWMVIFFLWVGPHFIVLVEFLDLYTFDLFFCMYFLNIPPTGVADWIDWYPITYCMGYATTCMLRLGKVLRQRDVGTLWINQCSGEFVCAGVICSLTTQAFQSP